MTRMPHPSETPIPPRGGPIGVFIVDDSAVVRQALSDIIAGDPV